MRATRERQGHQEIGWCQSYGTHHYNLHPFSTRRSFGSEVENYESYLWQKTVFIRACSTLLTPIKPQQAGERASAWNHKWTRWCCADRWVLIVTSGEWDFTQQNKSFPPGAPRLMQCDDDLAATHPPLDPSEFILTDSQRLSLSGVSLIDQFI